MMQYAATVVLTVAVAQGASLSGTVYLVEDAIRRPLSGARVAVRSLEGDSAIQSGLTDVKGRYQFADLPPKRALVSASKPGYFGLAAVPAEKNLMVNFAAGDVAGADFEMHRGGVITGRVTDPWGGPIEDIAVMVSQVTHFGGRHRHEPAVSRTNDRGVYRVFGLEPQTYVVGILPPESDGTFVNALLYPGVTGEASATELAVAAGAEVSGIDFVVQPQRAFRLIGRISDVSKEDLNRSFLQIAAVGASDDRSQGMPVERDGTFSIPALAPGVYRITAFTRRPEGGDRAVARQLVDMQSDVTNLVLRPGLTGRLAGRVTVRSMEVSRPKPEEIRLRVLDRSGRQAASAVARAPEYQFEFPDLWPDVYTLDIDPRRGYLLQVKVGSDMASEIAIPEGGFVRADVQVGLDFGQVTGTVKSGSGVIPHGRVALARAGTSPLEFQTVQADQRGEFIMSDVRPGEYLLGAWRRIDATRLYGPEVWQQARRFQLEQGAQVEIDLTAAP